MIIEETYELLKARYPHLVENLFIQDVVVGTYLTAVRLSDGSMGVASTQEEKNPFCSKDNRDFGSFTPLKIKRKKVQELFSSEKGSALVSSLKTATLNAISSVIISSGKYKVVEDCDPVNLLDLQPTQAVTIVGAFQTYINKFSASGARLSVLELDESALRPEHKRFYTPAENFREVISNSDIVIITGQTLVNRTIDELLSAVSEGSTVIITGPSSSLIPDVLFEKKVNMIGAVKLKDTEMAFEIVSQGGLGYHLFEYCATKICIVRE